MGKQIIERYSDKYDFYFLTEGLFERRPELLQAVVPAVDVIHLLNESAIGLFRDFDPEALPPIATWIHHVTSWSPDHQSAIDQSSALTVCTRAWKDYFDGRVSGRIPVTVVPHGVDSEFFQRKKVDRKRFGIPSNRFVVGFVGAKASDSDGGRKGMDVFFDVVRRVASRLPNLHVVLGGPGWDKDVADLRAQGISASAIGYIRKSDLPALYSALDVFLLTSRIEGGPCTVFEAMACETTVVSTRVGAVPELIVDGINGYSANVDDAEALVNVIVALEQSPDMRIESGKRGRETVSKLTWGATLGPLEGVYDELLQLQHRKEQRLHGPAWMNDPRQVLRASCAADALASVIARVRTRGMSPAKGIRMLRETLDQLSFIDIAKGAAMVKGWTFKAYPPPSPRLNSR
jgi:glycosyltransferase involved in cell wall biosynthesis